MNRISFAKKKKKKENSSHEFENGRLFVDCRACGSPDLGEVKCVKCLCSLISLCGEPDRILLRAGKDSEYHGDIVSIFTGLARIDSLARTMLSETRAKKCTGCRISVRKLLEGWGDFPEPDMDLVFLALNSYRAAGKECGDCAIQTYRMMEQMERSLNDLAASASRKAFSLSGV